MLRIPEMAYRKYRTLVIRHPGDPSVTRFDTFE